MAVALALAPASALAVGPVTSREGPRQDPPKLQRAPSAVAVEELLRSARLWQSLERPDAERGVLLKVLAVQGDEPRALFLLGELELRAGHDEEAHRALALLQASTTGRPNAAQAQQRRVLLAELQAMEAVFTRDRARLSELRLVMRGGNRPRALALARALFPNGRPPGDLANEFASVLTTTPSGWSAMRSHLQRRIATDPNSGDRLSLYTLLAQRPDTRDEALRGFAGLTQARDIEQERVAQAWRGSLRGSGDDDQGLEQRRQFLAHFPKDTEVRSEVARIEQAREGARQAQAAALAQQQASRDPSVLARQAAERALDAGQLAEAEAQLRISLQIHPQDAESIGTLGLLRFRQGRYAEATQRLDEAQGLEHAQPDLAARWRDLGVSARYWGALQQARRLRAAGQLDAAVRLVESVRATQPNQNEATHLLAALRAEQGRRADAQELYQQLLQQDGADGRAWRGWLSLELRQGRIEAVLDQAQGLPAKAGVPVEDALDPGELRDAIGRVTAAHPGAALRLLERGVGLLPREPWLRYDLAQSYLDLRLPALAQQVMQEGLSLAPDNAPMHYAAALIDGSLDQEDAAIARLEAVPATEQSDGMRGLAQRMRFERDLRLAQAARAADRTDEDAQWRTQALIEAGDDAGRRLRVARTDLAADDIDAARALLGELYASDAGLTLDERATLARLLIDAGQADRAMEQIDVLAVQASAGLDLASDAKPTLENNAAKNTDGLAQSLLLRARAHRAQHDAAATRADWAALEAVLAPEEVPRHIEAVELMVDDTQTAHAWMAELLRLHPQDPDVLLEAGRQERRDAHYDTAVQYLRAVGSGAEPAGAAAAGRGVVVAPLASGGPLPLLVPRAQPSASAAAPAPALAGAQDHIDWTYALGQLAASAPSAAAPDATQRAAQELEDIEARRQPRLETSWMHYSRSADEGLSSLHGNEIPLVAVWPGGYDGHWFAQLDTVHVEAGVLPAPLSSSAQFGKVLALPPRPTGLAAPIDEQAQGLSMAAGWRSDNRRFDLGLVGAGFKAPSIVGEWRENRIWDGTDVTADLSRRVLTGSLLSYAGAADPSTGAVWGGVTDSALTLRAGREFADRWSASTGLSLGEVSGRNVVTNFNIESHTVIERDWVHRSDFRLSAGASLSLWHYQANESFYTFGQGGYYSPQRYAAIGLPVEIEGRRGLWSYDARVVPSRSWTYEQNTPYYPTDSVLQRQAGNPMHLGGPGGGLAGSVRADIEYRAAPHWTVGAWLDIDRSAYYAPTRAMIYVRYWFKAQEGAVPFPPHPVLPISQY
jgi:tetratricopeptide (TPR) repeat protein